MIDYEILSHLERIDDLEKAALALQEVKKIQGPSLEEAQIITNLLIPFWKSDDVAIKTLANEAYNHLRSFHRTLEMPQEMLDSNVGIRKLKKEYEEFERKRTKEIPVFTVPAGAPPVKTPRSEQVPLEKQLFWKGSKALEDEDWEEAEKQFRRLLDICSEHAQAFLGRGVAIGRQDSAPDRMEEVIRCFEKARSYGLRDPKEAVAASRHLNSIAVNVFKTVIGGWEKQKAARAVPDPKWLIQAEAAFAALLLADTIHEGLEVMKNIHFSAHLLAEIETLPAEAREKYQATHAAFDAKIKALDPNFEKTKPGRCFVATATLGDPRHPSIQVLSAFRDTILVASSPGRLAIRGYYRIGPRLAGIISRTPWTRKWVLALLLRPATRLAAFFLRHLP